MKNNKKIQIIGIMLLIIFTMLSTTAFCKNNVTTSNDDSEYYENEESVDDLEEDYVSVQNDDLAEMQKKIDKLTKLAVFE